MTEEFWGGGYSGEPRHLIPLEDGLLGEGDRGKIYVAVEYDPKKGEKVAFCWNAETRTPVCHHRNGADTLISWLEYHKGPEDPHLCPQCHYDSLPSSPPPPPHPPAISNENGSIPLGRAAESAGLSGIISLRTYLLQSYAYSIWFDPENQEKRSEIRDALGRVMEEWVRSFRRSPLWTEEREIELARALLEDTLAKFDYSLDYRGADTPKIIVKRRAVEKKSKELKGVIVDEFDPIWEPSQDPRLTLEWTKNWDLLNDCYLDYVSDIAYQRYQNAATEFSVGLVEKIIRKGNQCMIYANLTGRTLEAVINPSILPR